MTSIWHVVDVASSILPGAGKTGILSRWNTQYYHGTPGVKTHTVGATAYLIGIAATWHRTLRVLLGKCTGIDDRVATEAL